MESAMFSIESVVASVLAESLLQATNVPAIAAIKRNFFIFLF
jgi:hypothetical protein